jgi:DNA-binding MarR family transcriptional regulator
MPTTLREELKQRKAFTSLEQEAQLSVLRTSAMLVDAFERILKPYGITTTQYNVLRILRGAEPDGLCRNDVRDRMLTRMPDVTRLLDRMEEAGLIDRTRETSDRRMVMTRITAKGKRLLDDLEDDVEREHERAFAALTKEQMRILIAHLAAVRQTL